MSRRFWKTGWVLALVGLFLSPAALDSRDEPDEKPLSGEDIARRARESVVVISASGRSGHTRGIGSGFIVRSRGVVATNYHVIGQGRPFTVQRADGSNLHPTAILAFDRTTDLALIQVEEKELPALELGDSDGVEPGQTVFAVGHPLGLELSVSQGVVAQRREIDGRELLQVAMPIEPGSSGSPLVNRQGRVVGVIAIKSAESLGFAVPINDLKVLLERAHPIPIERWLTIGALNLREWEIILGGVWQQRAGKLIASGWGEGFGGRTICLHRSTPPGGAFEVSVDVRQDDERGAAGLVFHSDGVDRHYGFYPTGGSLRLTRFDGPVVFTWNILATVKSEHYRPGDWNTLKVRVDGSKLTCSVNDRVVIDVADAGLDPGKIGLVKFRGHGAEFKRFRVGPNLPATRLPGEILEQVRELVKKLQPGEPPTPFLIEDLMALDQQAVRGLEEQARSREREVLQLRELADTIHRRLVEKKLVRVLSQDEEKIDLLEAALLLSRLDNPELELEPYRRMLDHLSEAVKESLGKKATGQEKIEALNRFLFEEMRFHGSDLDYYHRSNSYINEVLDDREGIPITLSIVFMELARRLDLPVVGVGIPGQFMVEWRPPGEDRQLIDVFQGGKLLSHEEAGAISRNITGVPITEDGFEPSRKREIIVRMLRNLLGIARGEEELEEMLQYLDTILALHEESAMDHVQRALLRYQLGQKKGALEDVDWLIEHHPEELDEEKVLELRAFIEGGG